MVGLIKQKIERSRFVRIWFALSVFLLVIFTARLAFSSQPANSLQDVLLNKSVTPNPFDPTMIILILLAFSLTTLSIAKGYEIFRRAKIPAFILPGRKNLPINNNGDKELIEELKISLDETRHSKENMLKENEDLRSKRKIMQLELEELKRVENMLRKSNLSLNKECERLKTENEEIMLKTSSLPTTEKKPIKAKSKTKAKRTSKKAEA